MFSYVKKITKCKLMLIIGRIVRPYYDVSGRKYFDLEIDGEILKVKIPFRYNRVMCKVHGIVPVQEIPANNVVEVSLERTYWEGNEFWVVWGVRDLGPFKLNDTNETRVPDSS
jgi:hypothetical protein